MGSVATQNVKVLHKKKNIYKNLMNKARCYTYKKRISNITDVCCPSLIDLDHL